MKSTIATAIASVPALACGMASAQSAAMMNGGGMRGALDWRIRRLLGAAVTGRCYRCDCLGNSAKAQVIAVDCEPHWGAASDSSSRNHKATALIKPKYHKETTMNSAFPNPDLPMDSNRRRWVVLTATAGGVGAAFTAVPFVASFAPSERAKAAGGPVEVDISDILPGGSKTVEWRGKPVWIVRRTPQMLAALQGHDEQLVDPQSTKDQQPPYAKNTARAIKPDIFVVIGICTHLGCSPNPAPAGSANPSLPADWPGGYFCPCHGSTFDGAGRVFKNKPAPTNLEIPAYRFDSDTRILIGDAAKA
jgi:ubiquinol-cytochrome c reductase iron-sulfur subunit